MAVKVMAMDVLPDCPRKECRAPVVLLADDEGAVEQCTGCGAAYWPYPPVGWQQEIRVLARQVKDMHRKGELPWVE